MIFFFAAFCSVSWDIKARFEVFSFISENQAAEYPDGRSKVTYNFGSLERADGVRQISHTSIYLVSAKIYCCFPLFC
jgi:hypothetical protein